MGLLNRQAGKPGPMGMGGGPMIQPPPQMGQMGRGMPGAFGSNPQFMAQLQQMMQMQPFPQPPRVGMPQQPQPGGGPMGGGQMGGGMNPGGIDPAMGSGFGMGAGLRPSMPFDGTSFDMFGARI